MHVVSQTTKPVTVVDQKSFDTTQTTIEVKSIDPLVDDSSSDGSPTTTVVKPSINGLGLNRLPSMDNNFSLAEPTTLEVREVSHLILDIIFEYALNKFDDSKERLAAGAAKFLRDIDRFVVAGTRVEACLPAFPFKSVCNAPIYVVPSEGQVVEQYSHQSLHHVAEVLVEKVDVATVIYWLRPVFQRPLIASSFVGK
jgi:hypothetical protein